MYVLATYTEKETPVKMKYKNKTRLRPRRQTLLHISHYRSYLVHIRQRQQKTVLLDIHIYYKILRRM